MRNSDTTKNSEEFKKVMTGSEHHDVNDYKEAQYGRQVYDLVRTPLYVCFLICCSVTIICLLMGFIDSVQTITRPLMLWGIADEMEERLIIALPVCFGISNIIGLWVIGYDATQYSGGYANKKGLTIIAAAHWILLGIVVLGFFITKPIFNNFYEISAKASVDAIVNTMYICFFVIGAYCIIVLMLVQKIINNMSIYIGGKASVSCIIVICVLIVLATIISIIKGETSLTNFAALGTGITAIPLLVRYRKLVNRL